MRAATTSTNTAPLGERTNVAMSKLLITGSPEVSTMRRPIQVTSGARDRKAEQLHEQVEGERRAPSEMEVGPGAAGERFLVG